MRSTALRIVIAGAIVAMAAAGCAKKKPTTVDTTTSAQDVGGFGPGGQAGTAPGGFGSDAYGAGAGTGVGQGGVVAGDPYANAQNLGAYQDGGVVAGDPYANAQNVGTYQGGAASPYGTAQGGSYNFAGDDGTPQYFSQRVGDRVLFDTDSTRLDGEAQSTLARQAAWLKIHPQHAITIEGHADERGTREYNLALGARRADATRGFLVSQGIDPNRIRTVSYGKERPVAPGSTPGAWRVNRRAVTTLAGGAGFGS